MIHPAPRFGRLPANQMRPCCDYDIIRRLDATVRYIDEVWCAPGQANRTGQLERRRRTFERCLDFFFRANAPLVKTYADPRRRLPTTYELAHDLRTNHKRVQGDLHALTLDPATPLLWTVDNHVPKIKARGKAHALYLLMPRQPHVCAERGKKLSPEPSP
jgi:hypothetical protein